MNDGTNWTSLTIGSDTYGVGGAPSNMVTTDTDQTITGKKKIASTSNTSSCYTEIKGTSSSLIKTELRLDVHNSNGSSVLSIINDGTSNGLGKCIYPLTGNSMNIGATNKRFNNLYLNGIISDGTNSVSVANIADKSNSETWTFTVDDGQGGTTTVTKTIVLG